MSDTDWNEVIAKINGLLRRDPANGWTLLWDADDAPWFGSFVSSLALAVGDEEIVYADGRLVENEDSSFVGDVVFFTAKALVVGRVTGDRLSAYEVEREVRFYRRKELQLVSVSALANAFSREPFQDWPGRVDITVRYAPDVEIELPVNGRSSNPAVRNELLALLASLRDQANS